jgi:hypothetical protein
VVDDGHDPPSFFFRLCKNWRETLTTSLFLFCQRVDQIYLEL